MRTITVSEIRSFLRCRRKWDLTSEERQNLTPLAAPIPGDPMRKGTLVHHGLAALKADRENWLEVFSDLAMQEERKQEEAYKAHISSGWSARERQVFWEDYDTATALVEEYADYWGDLVIPSGMEVLPKSIECSWVQPLGEGVQLSGTWDALLLDLAGRVWILEHKTYSTQRAYPALQRDLQFRIYAWAMCILIGFENFGGVIYDGMRSTPPAEPALVKSGKRLSKTVCTTRKKLRRAIEEHGFEAKDYLDLFKKCKESEGNFYHREQFKYSPAEIGQTELLLMHTVGDMMSDPTLYPHPMYVGCWDCGVQEACRRMDQGCHHGLFKRQDSYATRENVRDLEGTEVSDVMALVGSMR